MSIEVELSQIADTEMGISQTLKASKARWRFCWEAGLSLAGTSDSHTWLATPRWCWRYWLMDHTLRSRNMGFFIKRWKETYMQKEFFDSESEAIKPLGV